MRTISNLSSRAMDYPPPELSISYSIPIMQAEHPIKILLVEDDNGIAETLTLSLADHGIEIETKQTMRGALHRLHGERPDAILLDLMLPDSLSAQTIDSIRLLRRYAPVWVISGEGDQVIWAAVQEAGAVGWTQKPKIPIDEMAAALKEIVRIDRLDRALAEASENSLQAADKLHQRLLANGTINGK